MFRLACRLRFERIVSKRLAAPYLSDRIGAASRDGAARCREGRPGHDETTSSFFLVSTEIAGCPAANAAFTCIDVAELRIAIRMVDQKKAVAIAVWKVSGRPSAEALAGPTSSSAANF